MTTETFDLLIIGSGPGGYVAALRASQLGMKVALVEREELGGICLNWGCIPTKALLHSADVLRTVKNAAEMGILTDSFRIDFGKVMGRSRQVAQKLNRGVSHLLGKSGVRVIKGVARLLGGGAVEVNHEGKLTKLGARHIILATGASPRPLDSLPFEGNRVWGYREALSAKQVPASLAVIGAGAIGVEFASFYAAMGSNVTLIEAASSILPASDTEVCDFMQASMSKEGIRVMTATMVKAASVGTDGVQITVDTAHGPETLAADHALVAIGLVGNTKGLGLENTVVKVVNGHIQVSDTYATAEPGVFAIGDVTGGPMLAHRASYQAVDCVERLTGCRPSSAGVGAIPACVYAHPPSASIGLTEREARGGYPSVKVGKFSFHGNGKAIATGENEGFIKTIFDGETGELLGAHLVGPNVTELIHGYAVGQKAEATEEVFMDVIFPHPTLSEAMQEAVLAAYGRPLHA